MAKTPEEKAAAAVLKELQKKAKKLKVDFAGVPADELTVLVNAAEAAAAAQVEKEGQTVAPPIVPVAASDRVDVQEAQAQADAAEAAKTPQVTPAGDTVVQTVVTKNKEKHNLVVTPEGDVLIKNHFGVVTAKFDGKQEQAENVADGKRHLENLSRF